MGGVTYQTINESNIQVEEEDHGLGEVQGERTNKRHHDNVLAAHLLSLHLGLALQLVVPSDLAHTSSAAVEDVGRAGFREKEEDEDQAGTTENHQFPDRPSPAQYRNREPRDERSQCGTADGGQTPNTDTKSSFGRCVHVTDGCTTSCKHGRTEESRQESKGEEHADVRGEGGRNLQQDEDKQSPDVDGVPANVWNLGHGRPEHGTKTVPSDEQGQTESCDYLADLEFLLDTPFTRRVDSGTNVDGEGQETNLEGDEELLPFWLFGMSA